MVSRIILILAIIGCFAIHFGVWFGGDGIDIWTFVITAIVAGFQTLASIWVYKDIIGWNNFEKSEGLSLKRKKEDK